MNTNFKFVVNCEVLGLEESFKGTSFGHAFSKTHQYAIVAKKICKNLKYVSIKSTKFDIQKFVTWPKKFGKGRQEWMKNYIEYKIQPRTLNTLVKIR